MKNKKKVVIITLLFVIVVGILGYVWYKNSYKAELHKHMKQEGMLATSLGFSLDKKDEVVIRVKSKIKSGDAVITLQNSEGEVLYQFKTDCKEKKVITLEAGSYELHLDSEACQGDFDLTIR